MSVEVFTDKTQPGHCERCGEPLGQVAMIGGKDKTKIRNATPLQFRDLLLSIAASA